MQRVSTVFLSFLLVFLLSCTKEIPEPAAAYPDLSGYYNGYGYYYHASMKQMPLEVIEVKKTGPDEYTGIRWVGDYNMPAGSVSFKFTYKGKNPFPVVVFLGPTPNTAYNCSGQVESNGDILKIPSYGQGLVFIRRTDGYQP